MPKKKERWHHKLKVRNKKEYIYVERMRGKTPYRSESPHEAVTLDFDANGRLIGVEVLPAPKTVNID